MFKINKLKVFRELLKSNYLLLTAWSYKKRAYRFFVRQALFCFNLDKAIQHIYPLF